MYKSIFAILLVGLLLTGPALAGPPPVDPDDLGGTTGWGLNPNPWDRASGGDAMFALYDGIFPPECAGWNVDGQTGTSFSTPMAIYLWIELYASMTVNCVNVEIHRGDDSQDDVYFFIGGIFKSNSTQYVCLNPLQGFDMDEFNFQHDVMGRDPTGNEPTQDIDWYYQSGQLMGGLPAHPAFANGEGWTPYRSCVEIPKCDYWIWWMGWIDCWHYHLWDGYYLLSLKICPWPTM